MIETIKVKPWGKDQGDHVIINAEDFDPKVHELAAGEVAPAKVEAPEADPFDHDHDGKPGGSLPKAKPAPKRRAKRKGK